MHTLQTGHKITSNRLLNGETVNYAALFTGILSFFIVFRQVLKLGFSLDGKIAVFITFALSSVLMFFAEKKYVFNRAVHTKPAFQAMMAVVRFAIDLGLFQLSDFVFGSLLKGTTMLVYIIACTMVCVFNYYFGKLIIFDCRTVAEKRNGGRVYRVFYDNRFVLLSILISALCMTFVYAVYKAFPFGDATVMRMDLYHQYGPLHAELFDRIVNHKSFLYSWTSGGGTSFLGDYFNYLSSPFALMILLFDRKDMSLAITTMVFVKCLLCSGTFAYYLKSSQRGSDYFASAFGVFYAFSGYFLAYYWNIMWVDGMILFPLIMLGIERIIDCRKPALYIAALTLLLYSTYYIGFMTCIFAVVYFIAYFFLSNKKPARKTAAPVRDVEQKKMRLSFKGITDNRFLTSGVTFACASLFAGVLCAVTLIPVFFILQDSSATSDAMPGSMESYFDLLDLITSHLAGLTTTIRSSGEDVLPNIYCGTLAVILIPLFVMNKKISIKEKTVYILLIIFFVFSFNNNMANFFWHAKHFPNDLPYRFSFMYSFIILVIGYKTLKRLKGIEYRDIAVAGFFWLLLVLYFEKNPTEKFNDITIYVTIGLTLIWTAALLLIRKGLLPKVILGVTVVALTFCEVIIADTQAFTLNWTNTEYTENYDLYRDTVQYVEDKDKDFYRQELCELDTRMDPCLYGYNGISIFSSMAYEDYSQLQYSMGMYGNRINSYTYHTQTPIYNMMNNIKYVTWTKASMMPSDDYYEHFYSTEKEDAKVFRNKAYLPISFVTKSDVKEWYFDEGDPFEVQEDFLSKAAGVSNVFLPCDYVSTVTNSCECEDIVENGVYSFSKDTETDGGSIEVTIKAVNDDNVYIYISSGEIENVNYFWNNEEETADQNIDTPYIFDLGKHKKGDEIRVEISLAGMETESAILDIYAYNLNNDVLDSAYDLLKEGGMEVTSYGDTFINGTVNAGFDGYLYSSIPYDEGWSVYIDGKKAETFKLGDSMLCTEITAGKHNVTYKFMPKGLNYGLVISGAGWLCLMVYGIYRYLTKKGKKRNCKNGVNITE